jgi:HlyD family secretion protein
VKVALLGIGVAIAGTTAVTLVRQSSTHALSPEAAAVVRLVGSVESREVEVANEVAGRIVALPVGEGDAVEPGALLATLDDEDARLRLARLEAALHAAKAQLDDLRGRPRKEELALPAARVAEEEVALAKARADLERLSHAESVVARQDIEEGTAAARLAAQRLETAKCELALVAAGARPAEIEAASAHADELAREVDLAARELAKCRVTAPLAGTVLRKNFEAGELAPAGSRLVTIIDTSETWVELAADERLLGRIALGEAAEIRAESGSAPVAGHVSFIADKHAFTPRDALTLDERSKLTYRVKVKVDGKPPAWLRPGMFVEVSLGGAGSR